MRTCQNEYYVRFFYTPLMREGGGRRTIRCLPPRTTYSSGLLRGGHLTYLPIPSGVLCRTGPLSGKYVGPRHFFRSVVKF